MYVSWARRNQCAWTRGCTQVSIKTVRFRVTIELLIFVFYIVHSKKFNAEHEKVAALSSRVYRLKRRHKGFSKPAKYRPPGSGKNLANPGPPPEVVEIPAAEPKSISPSGDDQRDIPAIRSPVVEPRIPNAPVESESKTSSVIAPSSSPCGTNEVSETRLAPRSSVKSSCVRFVGRKSGQHDAGEENTRATF